MHAYLNFTWDRVTATNKIWMKRQRHGIYRLHWQSDLIFRQALFGHPLLPFIGPFKFQYGGVHSGVLYPPACNSRWIIFICSDCTNSYMHIDAYIFEYIDIVYKCRCREKIFVAVPFLRCNSCNPNRDSRNVNMILMNLLNPVWSNSNKVL